MKAKVLIIEDNEALLLFYKIEVQAMGYQVILAKDGFEAIEKLNEQRPDLVVLDLNMNHMHGFEALRKVIRIDSTIPIIIHTAYYHYKDHFLSWAAEDYILKSSDLRELKRAIQRTLHQETPKILAFDERKF